MGLWSWLFPTPQDRVARAREAIARGRPDHARLDLLDLDLPEAKALLAEAENALALLNLEAAVQRTCAGDDRGAADCLELAEKFHRGGHEEAFQRARRELREIRTSRDAKGVADKAEQRARVLAVDPLGMTGGPRFDDPEAPPLDPADEELEQRLALVVESYPAALRPGVARLGAPFAGAVLDLEEGRADLALQQLALLPDDEPLVWWERARAAQALGDPKASAEAVRAFARHADGHHAVGNEHSAAFLAARLAEVGDLDGALRVLREVRAADPRVGTLLFAQLLAATGAYPEADRLVAGLVREHPRTPGLYVLLAKVRLAGGQRAEAMRALEAGLEAVCCTPGKCGAQPPDHETHRMLATLYLEERRDVARGLELADKAAALAGQPTVDDAYLAALVARAKGAPDARDVARRLRERLPPGHPVAERLAALV